MPCLFFFENQKAKRRLSDDHQSVPISNVLKKGINIKIHHCPSKQAYNRQHAESLEVEILSIARYLRSRSS